MRTQLSLISLVFFFLASNAFAEKKDWGKIRQKHRKKQIQQQPEKDLETVNTNLVPLTNAIYFCRQKNPKIRGKDLKDCIAKIRRLKNSP